MMLIFTDVHGVGPQGARADTEDTFFEICGKRQNRPSLAVPTNVLFGEQNFFSISQK
jgi:hypothetical protein